MNASPCITLDLVRHGEVRTRGLLCASPEEPLSPLGLAQMRVLQRADRWDLILCSPSLRCCGFAQELSELRDVPLQVDPAWREMDFGLWTGQTRDALWESDRDTILRLWQQPLDFVAPEGEAMTDFVARVHSAFNELLEQHAGKKLLLITHAGVIRAILVKALGIDYIATQRFSVGHGKINRIRAYADGEFSLLNWGGEPP